MPLEPLGKFRDTGHSERMTARIPVAHDPWSEQGILNRVDTTQVAADADMPAYVHYSEAPGNRGPGCSQDAGHTRATVAPVAECKHAASVVVRMYAVPVAVPLVAVVAAARKRR